MGISTTFLACCFKRDSPQFVRSLLFGSNRFHFFNDGLVVVLWCYSFPFGRPWKMEEACEISSVSVNYEVPRFMSLCFL